ncbi:MAG: amino acid ABC transporter permease [Actinobacteria bacterium]|nr:amino acid ABC transporter permease [Actinomycetota bacterium]
MRPRVNLQEDVDLVGLPLEDERPVEVAPARVPATPGEWIRDNLFSSVFNGVLTVVTGALALYLGYQVLRWILVTAEWAVVKANLRIYMIGRFPLEEAWRVWASVFLVAVLGGLSFGVSGHRLRWTLRKAALRAALAALVVGALVFFLDGPRIWILTGSVPVLLAASLKAGRAGYERLRVPLWIGWGLAFPVVMVLLRGFGGVPPKLWGGFLLNVVVAVVAIFLSFPAGVLLAVGRRSSLRAVSSFCVGFIELIRGVPLVTLIIAGFNLLPLMLPSGMDLALIVRMMLIFTIFSAAYVAEIVRGGLQGIPFGQYEAARALGLSTTRILALVILPQALRSTIPAMISHFISLFKDTSLLAVLAITELLRAARRASAQLEFLGAKKEAVLAAAVLFWVVAFSMSRWSQRLERRLGVGER